MARMEDVIEVYHRPYDEKRPLICIDESSKQLVSEVRTPLPARAGTKRIGVIELTSEPRSGGGIGWSVAGSNRRSAPYADAASACLADS